MIIRILFTAALALVGGSARADFEMSPVDKVMRYIGAFSPAFDRLEPANLDRALVTLAEIFSMDFYHQSDDGPVEKWSEHMLEFIERSSRPHWPLEPARQAVLDDPVALQAMRDLFRTHATEIKAAYDVALDYHQRRERFDRALLFADGVSNEMRGITFMSLVLQTVGATVVGGVASYATGNVCGMALAGVPLGMYWGGRYLRHYTRGPRLALAQRKARPALVALKDAMYSLKKKELAEEDENFKLIPPARAIVTDIEVY
jgi:hypothetical protein